MRPLAIIKRSQKNLRRNGVRTGLTASAILVGALTLTLTSALGAGVNKYIDDTVASFGAENVIFVTNPTASSDDSDSEPAIFDEEQLETDLMAPGPEGGSTLVNPISEDIIDEIADIDGVDSVQPSLGVSIEYLATDGDPYIANNAQTSLEIESVLLAGSQLNDDSDFQVILPSEYLDVLDFKDAESAVGESVTIGYYDYLDLKSEVEAEIVGVADGGLGGPIAGNLVMNPSLIEDIYESQFADVSGDEEYSLVTVFVDEDLVGTDDFTAVLDELEEIDLATTTVEDQLGDFTVIIDAVIWILNGFALVVLLASGFGIVNTLFMSVQERTREIGLMKSIGATPRAIFSLFSLEAALIGLLGSISGILIGVVLGNRLNVVLQDGLLADLTGFIPFIFEPQALVTVLVVVVGIALIAGILPARGASRKDPITALRYE